jgi:site-specific recombinase XerD
MTDLAAWLEEFITAKTAGGRSLRTLQWYREQIAIYIAWIDHNGGDPLAASSIERFLAAERKKKLSDYTIGGRYRALSAFFHWLPTHDLVPAGFKLPIDQVEKPKEARTKPRHVRIEDYDRLLSSIPLGSWIDHRDRLAVVTLFLTAVRRDELVHLTIDDYDLAGEVLIVRAGKGGDTREIPLLPAVRREFVQYRMVRPDDAWPGPEVFLAADGAGSVRGVLTGSGIFQRMRTLCRRGGVRHLNPHSFRHGLAMHLLNKKGADMALIQRILGHKEITTTSRIYARWEIDGVAATYVRLMRDDGQNGVP